MLMDDDQLLRAYADHRSEEAFRELVRRHVAVVQGVARRRAGIDAHLADDVAQRVFIALARKADSLRDQTTLVGWLYTAARLEAVRAVRTEARRRHREEKAAELNSMPNEETPVSWERLRPVLDEAMAQLGESDRNAILLRFFSGQSFTEVGRVFQISEEAARKRVDRAIEKLRETLGRRGIASTAAALGTALGAHAAPAVTSEALAAIAAGAWQQASVSAALPLGVFMSSTKMTVAVAGVVILFAVTAVVRDAAALTRAESSQAAAEADLAALRQRSDTARRELAAVQRKKAEADARERELIATTQNPLRPYLQDPAYRALARTASQARRHLEFQRLYRALGLSPDQIERFEQIMVRQDQANLDGQVARDLGRDEQAVFRHSGPEWNSAMRSLLGEGGMAQLQDYLRSMAVRNFVDDIAAKSYESGEPITLEQADRLTALALAHDPLYQQGKGTDPGKVSWNAVWEPAAKFLSPQQVVTFETAVEVWSLQKRISLGLKAAAPGNR
jgi:RNA polymerase sigma factor (sigma-70 family)